MKDFIFRKVLKLIWKSLKGKNWKVFLYGLWTSEIKPIFEDIVKDTATKFDDAIFKGLEEIIEFYLNPKDKEMGGNFFSEFKAFFEKVFKYIKSKLTQVDWELICWTLWVRFGRKFIKGLVEKTPNKFGPNQF